MTEEAYLGLVDEVSISLNEATRIVDIRARCLRIPDDPSHHKTLRFQVTLTEAMVLYALLNRLREEKKLHVSDDGVQAVRVPPQTDRH